MTPEIIEFKPEHLTAFEWREGNREENAAWAKELMEKYELAAWTGKVDDRIIGVGALALLGNDCAYAMMFLARDIEQYEVWFHRTVRRYFCRVIAKHGIKHVGAWVREDSLRNRAWIEAMGFTLTDPVKREDDGHGNAILNYQVGII